MSSYDILNEPLPSESHETEQLRIAIAEAEALGYRVAIKIGEKSKEIAALERQITTNYTRALIEAKKEKVDIAKAMAEDAVKDLEMTKAEAEAELKFYKHVQGLVENRCSVGQSFLSNTTSQIKAGINLQSPENK